MSAPDRGAADARLLERVAGGDREALAALYDRFTPLLFPVALRIAGSRADAEDVLQEVWVQVWRRASSFDASRGSVPAWLMTITRSRSLDFIRARSARAKREEGSEPQSQTSPDPGRSAESASVREKLRAAFAELGPERAQVLELAYWEGLSQSEIAERTGSPLGTVKSWTRQGLARMRKILPEGEWW